MSGLGRQGAYYTQGALLSKRSVCVTALHARVHVRSEAKPSGATMGFEGLDFYLLDEELSEDERLARDTVRRFVDAEVTPIIDSQFALFWCR